jgi:hypothetical protein
MRNVASTSRREMERSASETGKQRNRGVLEGYGAARRCESQEARKACESRVRDE